MQKAPKSGVQLEVRQGLNCIKSKVYGKSGMQLKLIERWRTKLNIKKKLDNALSSHCLLSSIIFS